MINISKWMLVVVVVDRAIEGSIICPNLVKGYFGI